MKKLDFQYQMKISLDAPVGGHRFTLRCTPQSDARQQLTALQVSITPYDELSKSCDQWGNVLLYGCCREPHSDFSLTVSGSAKVGLSDSLPAVEYTEVFRCETHLTHADAALCAFADSMPTPKTVPDAMNIMSAVHGVLQYQSGSTNVRTTAAEAYQMGCGVCQDYSHIMLSVLRHKGIPARYVVGMLMGEGKSHAWVEVLLQNRWYAFDPTNDIPVTDSHIKISHGRDFDDCRINRGIFLGFSNQRSDISVIVTEA